MEQVKSNEENLVKKTCKELGITQKELAERIGISHRTLSRYIVNNKMPLYLEKYIKLMIDNNFKTKLLYEFQNSVKNLKAFNLKMSSI